jgi:cytochrome c oxidase subunit II
MILAESGVAEKFEEAFAWIGGISLVLLAGVTLAMIYFVVRFHRSKNRRPAQIEGHLGLELTWIIIPTILVMIMFFKGYSGFALSRRVPPGAKEIDVIGQQWVWVFDYPEEKISAERLYVPVDTPIRFNLKAKMGDVSHSFYLPDFRLKEDCVPGKVNHLWIHPREVGVFNIFCAEFCGKDHAKMITEMEVLSHEDYAKWVESKIAERFKPVDVKEAADPASPDIKSRATDKNYKTYCASCHGLSGRGGLVEGARTFTSLQDWKNGAKLNQIYRTLETGIEGTQMRSFVHLPPWDRFALAHKVRSFYQGDDLPMDTPEELQKLNEEFKLDRIKPPKKKISIERAIDLMAEDKE